MDDSRSVYQLITKLCETYINHNSINRQINKENLKKTRSKCYQILLSKQLVKSRQYLEQNSDSLCNLLAWQFQLLWEGVAPEHGEEFRRCMEKLQKLDILKQPLYSNFVMFLMELRNKPSVRRKIMDVTVNNDAVLRHKNSYLYDDSRFHLKDNDNDFNAERFQLHKTTSFQQKLKITDVQVKKQTTAYDFGDEGYGSPSKELDIWEIASSQPFGNRRTWETFDSSETQKELPFVCESGSQAFTCIDNLPALEQIFLAPNTCDSSTFNTVSQKDFIKCVKYLLVGIESFIFKYNQQGELAFVSGIVIEGLSVSSIKSYCKDLVTCSSCYKGLNSLCTTCPIDSKGEQNGYIFLELCTSIKRYLSYYRVAVLSLSDSLTLLKVHQQTKTLRTDITLLASVCKVGPFKESGEILHGVTLLNYLYKNLISLINKESLMVLYAVVFPCCKVYFRRFIQQWILEGSVHDPYGEFFINTNVKYINTRGRTYWTRSFTIREDIVPEFLTDLRQDILFCGKTMNLLKLCMPNSALCLYLSEKRPNILHCCVLPDQLPDVQYNNYTYYLETSILSGPRIQLRDILHRARDRSKLFLHLVAKKRAATLYRIELERKKQLQLEFEKKQAEMKVLRNNYYEAMSLKSITLAKNLEKEIRELENSVKLQALQNKIIGEEKERLIDYYDKLSQESEKRWDYYKRQVENLKCELNLSPHIERVINAELVTECKSSINSFTTSSISNPTVSVTDDPKSPAVTDSLTSVTDDLDVINANTEASTEIKPELVEKQEIETTALNISAVTNLQYIENKKAAERNKAKVLSLELGIINPSGSEIKTTNTTELTEAQKNRLKVMASEFGTDLQKSCKTKSTLSVAEANKMKMLSSNECFVFPAYPNSEKQESCDNANYINRNVEVDNNTNIIDIGKNTSEMQVLDVLIEDLSKTSIKKSKMLTLDLPLANKCGNDHVVLVDSAPKVELPKTSPMSVDSVSISSMPSPNLNQFDVLKSSPAVTTAKTEAMFDSVFAFEADSASFANKYEKRRTEFQLEKFTKLDLQEQLSTIDATKINPGCLKFCLQQSVVIPLITQMQLGTNELLNYYINELHYLDHLNSLRNYFFLLDGEFCRNITEGLFGKLYDVNFPIDLINLHTLQILMYNALDYSTKFQENSGCLSFKINSLPKVFDLCDPDVFDCISLTYKISWPLNILLPVDTITKYDEIFKLLLKIHRISWVLHTMFQDLKLLTKEVEKQYREILMVSPHYTILHHYRHVMTHFVQTLENYVVEEILQSSWHVFEKKLETVKTFDQLYGLHSIYIKNILFLCLLNQKSAPLRTALQKIFLVILKFFSYLRSRCWSIGDDNIYIHPNFNKLESLFSNFEDLVLYFFKLGHKVVKSGYQPQLMQLLNMLDVNNYYTRKLSACVSSSSSATQILE